MQHIHVNATESDSIWWVPWSIPRTFTFQENTVYDISVDPFVSPVVYPPRRVPHSKWDPWKVLIVNCNLFMHEALRCSYEFIKTCLCIPDRIGSVGFWWFEDRKNLSTWRKTSWSKGENQQQTQPTYGIHARIWTLGHTGGRRVLSSLHHLFSPEERVRSDGEWYVGIIEEVPLSEPADWMLLLINQMGIFVYMYVSILKTFMLPLKENNTLCQWYM